LGDRAKALTPFVSVDKEIGAQEVIIGTAANKITELNNSVIFLRWGGSSVQCNSHSITPKRRDVCGSLLQLA
jgi:hypothetical protein